MSSHSSVRREGTWSQVLRVGRGARVASAFEGVASGGEKVEGWERVETMIVDVGMKVAIELTKGLNLEDCQPYGAKVVDNRNLI